MTASLHSSRSQHPHLSETVLSLIVERAVENWRLVDCLRLRLVNHHFNHEVHRQLYTLFRINRKIGNSFDASCANELVAVRYWQAFVGNHSPDRSYKEMKHFPDPDIDRCSQHVHKQKRRLRRIHTTLRETVETMTSLVKAKRLNLHGCRTYVDQEEMSKVRLHQTCTAVLSQAATCLLGPQFAWSFVHFQQKSHIYWVLYRSGRDSDIESFYEKHLFAKPAKFWVTLVAAYVGDTAFLQEVLESISIKHKDPSKWMDRLATSYLVFSSKSSAVERRWLEVLSACLTVAINKLDFELVNYMLEQDPAVSMLAFQSISFNEYNLLDLAIRRHSVSIMTTLLNHSWLISPNGKISDAFQYEKTIMATARLSQDLPDRDEMMLRLLSLSHQWQTVPRLQKILNYAVRRNDVRLVEIILSTMTNQPATFDGVLTMTDFSSRDNGQTPLQTAVNADQLEMVHLLLENSEALRLHEMTTTQPPFRDFRTEALLELLRKGLEFPPRRVPGSAPPDTTTDTDTLTVNNININILAALLEHSTDIHDRQVEAIVEDDDGPDLLAVFLRYVDLTAQVSATTGHQVGEVALATAAANQDLRTLSYLLDERGFLPRCCTTKTTTTTTAAAAAGSVHSIPAPAQWRRTPYHNFKHHEQIRTLLAEYRLVFDYRTRMLRGLDDSGLMASSCAVDEFASSHHPHHHYHPHHHHRHGDLHHHGGGGGGAGGFGTPVSFDTFRHSNAFSSY